MKVYKYNEDLGKMIEIGTLVNNELIFNVTKSCFDNDSIRFIDRDRFLYGYDISLYNYKFFIKLDSGKWDEARPNNVIQVTTGTEGITYTLGHIKDGVVIFYDQYIGE